MNAKAFGLGLAAAAFVATSALPAQAQVVDDFLCSTFSFHCAEAPPPPPPTPAIAPDPMPAEPVKKVKHHAKKKIVKKKAAAAPAADAAPATPAPDAAAPK